MKFVYKGAFHIHTTYSDGTGTIKQIAKDAKKAGLDWIVITDHNNLSGLHNNEEGWYDGLAVIVGSEISPKTKDHYVAVGIKENICCSNPPEEFIKKVKEQGGFGFIAHPDESENRKNIFPPLKWTDWEMKDFGGIEIWNHLSDWTDNYDEKFVLYQMFKRHSMLNGPTAKVLKWWDDSNNENEHVVPAVGSLDSHAFDYAFVKIFPYYDSFKTITNHLHMDKNLSSDFDEAKEQILNALKFGNNIIANRIWNKNDSQVCFSITNNEQEVFAGQKINLHNSSKLLVKLPQKAKIKLLHNGLTVLEKESDILEFNELSSGKYRFEASYKNKPWIFSNPILVEE